MRSILYPTLYLIIAMVSVCIFQVKMLIDNCKDSHHPANPDDARTIAVIMTDYLQWCS